MAHELDTELRPGETLIANMAVQFPSHDYKRLMGFRSFRDFQGRDISAELPGWPPSRKPGEPPAKASVKGVSLTGAWIAGEVFVFLLGLAGLGEASNLAPDPEDRDDYTVLRADPGTFATGAPWQLDPGRNKANPRVVLHVTNQRLLFSDPWTDEVLWEFGREDVKTMTCDYVMRITFVDDSWIRIRLAKDKKALIPETDKDYKTAVTRGSTTRIPTSSPNLRFLRALDEFWPPAASE